ERGFAWQVALPEQVGAVLERRLAREVGDVEAPVGEAPVGAIEIAQPRLGGDDALEPSDQLAAFTHRMAPLWALTVSRRSGRCKPPSYSVATNHRQGLSGGLLLQRLSQVRAQPQRRQDGDDVGLQEGLSGHCRLS